MIIDDLFAKFRCGNIYSYYMYNSINKSGKRRYSYIVVNGLNAYFDEYHTNSKRKYTEDDVVNMINCLIDNIFIEFGGRIFQQTVGIPMKTNCAPLLCSSYNLVLSFDCSFCLTAWYLCICFT